MRQTMAMAMFPVMHLASLRLPCLDELRHTDLKRWPLRCGLCWANMIVGLPCRNLPPCKQHFSSSQSSRRKGSWRGSSLQAGHSRPAPRHHRQHHP